MGTCVFSRHICVSALVDVFGTVVASVINTWQSLQFSSGPNTTFFNFCDALEVKDGEVAGPDGWGLEQALAGWGSYYKNGPFLLSSKWCLRLNIWHSS